MQMFEDLDEQIAVKAALDKDAGDTKRNRFAAARAESDAIKQVRTEHMSAGVTENVEWHVTREKMYARKNDQELVMILTVYVMCVVCSVTAVRRNSCCCAGAGAYGGTTLSFSIMRNFLENHICCVCNVHHHSLQLR